jgi:hypothetical protein
MNKKERLDTDNTQSNQLPNNYELSLTNHCFFLSTIKICNQQGLSELTIQT